MVLPLIAFIVFYKDSILHLIFFLRDRYVLHNKKSRKKNFVFNLLRMRKEGCIKINRVFLKTFLKTKFCIIRNLILNKISLKRIIRNVKEVKIAATNTYEQTITDVKSCITKDAANIYSFITDIIVNTIYCVKNAPEDNPSTTIKSTTHAFDV